MQANLITGVLVILAQLWGGEYRVRESYRYRVRERAPRSLVIPLPRIVREVPSAAEFEYWESIPPRRIIREVPPSAEIEYWETAPAAPALPEIEFNMRLRNLRTIRRVPWSAAPVCPGGICPP